VFLKLLKVVYVFSETSEIKLMYSLLDILRITKRSYPFAHILNYFYQFQTKICQQLQYFMALALK